MPEQVRTSSTEFDLGTVLLLSAIFGVAGLGVLTWAGGVLASLLTGRGMPHAAAVSGLRTLAHPGLPARGWRTGMPGPIPYWTVIALLVFAIVGLAVLVMQWWRRDTQRHRADVHASPGLATRGEVQAHASARALLRRGPILRPSLERPRPAQVGYRLGGSRGVEVWT